MQVPARQEDWCSDWRCRHMKQFKELKDFHMGEFSMWVLNKGVLNMGEFNIKKFNNYVLMKIFTSTYKLMILVTQSTLS
jgi:hypothetical protein